MWKRGSPGKQIRVSRGTEIRGDLSQSESADGEKPEIQGDLEIG